MKTEELKWLDTCKKCGKVVNAKIISKKQNPGQVGDDDDYYNEFGFLPWKCDCGEFNNLRN